MNNVACAGTETNIVYCPSDGWAVSGSCTHNEDISVSCQGKINTHIYPHINKGKRLGVLNEINIGYAVNFFS